MKFVGMFTIWKILLGVTKTTKLAINSDNRCGTAWFVPFPLAKTIVESIIEPFLIHLFLNNYYSIYN